MLAVGAAFTDVPGFQPAAASTITCLETLSLLAKAEAGACYPSSTEGFWFPF